MIAKGKLSFGLKTTQQNVTYAEMRKVWKEADSVVEIDHMWLWDHMLPMRGDPAVPVPDGWTMLAALAEQTERVRIGLMVTNNLIRPPAVLAKMAATADIISGGRVVVGIGAGASTGPESAAYGLPEPPAAERIGRLREACTIIRRLWMEPAFDFSGRFYQLSGALCEPKPAQRPRPPIMIGGTGEKLLLRVAAEHADIWNMPGPPHYTPGEFRRKNAVLEEHCAAVGRDPREIIRSVQTHIDYRDPAATHGTLTELIEAGARHLVLNLAPPYPDAAVRWVADEIVRPLLSLHSRLTCGNTPAA
jgi:alkanesulfonate monooxygenase SsuD/methylene tetrahydromethanopterin reductase-like flavin-dependent oxidoreductase (luciferase family)